MQNLFITVDLMHKLLKRQFNIKAQTFYKIRNSQKRSKSSCYNSLVRSKSEQITRLKTWIDFQPESTFLDHSKHIYLRYLHCYEIGKGSIAHNVP